MGWYNPAWTLRKQITIDNTKVSGASHTSFPILVSVTDADIKAAAQADGDDILFTASDGTTKLDHEIEKWDNGTGILAAWVRIPTLSGSVDTDIYVYYGNPSASSQQNPTGVWDSDYKCVWHLNDDFLDSTLNNIDLTNSGSSDIAGKIADGQDFTPNNYIYHADDPLFDFAAAEFLVESWFKTDNNTAFQNIISHGGNGGASDAAGWNFAYSSGVLRFFVYQDASTLLVNLTGSWTPTNGVWYRVGIGRDSGGNLRLLVNGVQVGTSVYAATVSYGTAQLRIGTSHQGNRSFDGVLDEPRISHIYRSLNWLLTEYENQNTPGTFYSVGPEQEPPGSTLTRTAGVLDRTAAAVLIRTLTA